VVKSLNQGKAEGPVQGNYAVSGYMAKRPCFASAVSSIIRKASVASKRRGRGVNARRAASAAPSAAVGQGCVTSAGNTAVGGGFAWYIGNDCTRKYGPLAKKIQVRVIHADIDSVSLVCDLEEKLWSNHSLSLVDPY
jgi:hypothetical protein